MFLVFSPASPSFLMFEPKANCPLQREIIKRPTEWAYFIYPAFIVKEILRNYEKPKEI
jgi:hypothetical protein